MTIDKLVWSERLEPAPVRGDDRRDPFERDYARVLHSHSFRKLSSKTQVLGAHSSGDFHRTRLSHSLEVAQIACGILGQLKVLADEQQRLALPSSGLMNACALAHDLGHAPFGHAGENSLNYLMRDAGGFESNAQALRMLSRLENYSEQYGLNPTRRFLLGVMKYPISYSEALNPAAYPEAFDESKVSWECFKPPKCYYDSEQPVVEFVLEPFSYSDKQAFIAPQQFDDKHHKSQFKSLDCSILDTADDIAFGVHDLEDAIFLKLVNREDFEAYTQPLQAQLKLDLAPLTNQLFSKDRRLCKFAIGALVNHFVTECSWHQREQFESPLLQYNVAMARARKQLLEALIALVHEYVICNRNVQMYCYSGCRILVDLFELFVNEPQRFLSDEVYQKYRLSDDPTRVICDYVAGLTDDYARVIWRKLFTSESGSIFDSVI